MIQEIRLPVLPYGFCLVDNKLNILHEMLRATQTSTKIKWYTLEVSEIAHSFVI